MTLNIKSVLPVLLMTLFFAQASKAQFIKPEDFAFPSTPEKIEVNKKFADASAVVLKDIRILNFFYDKDKPKEGLQSFYTTHKVIQINDTRAIESYNKIYIPLSGVIDILDIRARTISPNGTIVELNRSTIKEIQNKEGEGNGYKIFAVEGLEKGSRLEYYFKLKKEFETSFTIVTQGSVPVQLQQIHIICPGNLKFDYKTYNGKSESVDSLFTEEGSADSKRRFAVITSTNVPGKDEEKYSNYNADLMRHEIQLAYNYAVGKSRIYTYNSAVQRMYPMFYENDPKATKPIQKLSSELGLGKLSPEDKIRHIENYIKTNIPEVKTEGPDYIDVVKILQKRLARSTGLIRVYLHMFAANGITCQVVYTTDRTKVWFDPDFETWNFLDESILYFPDFDKYLDPGSIVLRYPEVLPGYTANNGLFMEEVSVGKFKSAMGTVKKIPPSDVSKNAEIIDAYCKFNNSLDSVNVTVTHSYTGGLASNDRFAYNYLQKDEKKKLLDELVRFCMPDGKIISEEMLNYDMLECEKPLEIKGEVRGTALIEKTGKDVLFKIGDLLGPQTELYQEKPRESDIDMQLENSQTRILKVEIPEGYKLSGLEALKNTVKFDYEGKEACGFIATYEVKGNLLTVNITEYYNVIRLPKSEFENFRKVINASADFNKINIVLEKI